MVPVEFPQQNIFIGAGQPEYMPLPAHIDEAWGTPTTSCWELSWRERIRVLFTGKLYLQQLTFGSRLQPQRAFTDWADR